MQRTCTVSGAFRPFYAESPAALASLRLGFRRPFKVRALQMVLTPRCMRPCLGTLDDRCNASDQVRQGSPHLQMKTGMPSLRCKVLCRGYSLTDGKMAASSPIFFSLTDTLICSTETLIHGLRATMFKLFRQRSGAVFAAASIRGRASS